MNVPANPITAAGHDLNKSGRYLERFDAAEPEPARQFLSKEPFQEIFQV